ncbi:MAG: phosphoenolpyruvate carboxykinase (ATP), partial [Atopobiaceae bacterium]|nr:phosphoenolpyruvate carboxykinase (ATP) [Atopobiaceae bacterium]
MISDDFDRVGMRYYQNRVNLNLSPTSLVEIALLRGEGELTSTGSLRIVTGKYTGRSPDDRFIVDTPEVHDKIAWGKVNMPFSVDGYERLRDKVAKYLEERVVYVTQSIAGADRRYSRKFEVICEKASQALFARQLLVRPTEHELRDYDPDFIVMVAPDFKCNPEADGTNSEACVLINFTERVIIVVGTSYCGEVTKSIFSTMNYLLPTEDNVLPMHCSCNMNPRSHGTTVFFGLSGTGKTTLSAAEDRMLIGDDEHGWA